MSLRCTPLPHGREDWSCGVCRAWHVLDERVQSAFVGGHGGVALPHACVQGPGEDPSATKGIIHFDAYPVHTADNFRQWQKECYPMLLLVYVPAKCTSKMQIADVAYNRTLKAVFTAQHQQFMMQEYRRQMAEGRTAAQVKFSDAVSKCARRALVWLMKAYQKLEEVHVQSHLEQIGYMCCWEDADFLGRALENSAVLLPCRDDVGVEDGPVPDGEHDILQSMLALELGDVQLN